MLLRRLRVYYFTTKLAKPDVKVPFCGCCFSRFVISHANAYSAAHNFPQFD